MAYIRMRGLSDWTKLACLDPAILAVMHENAQELQAIMAFISLEDIEYLSSHALTHLRNRLITAGIVPGGISKATAEEVAREESRQRHLEKKTGKKAHIRADEFVKATISHVEQRMDDGHNIRGSGLRQGRYNNEVRLTRKRLWQAGVAPITHADGAPRVQRISTERRLPKATETLPCPGCGKIEGVRKHGHGYACLLCGWGKDLFLASRLPSESGFAGRGLGSWRRKLQRGT